MKSNIVSRKIVIGKMLIGMMLVVCFVGVFACKQKKKDMIINQLPNISILPSDTPEGVYILVEQMPEFPGGDSELHKFIAQSLKYPKEHMESCIQGKVFVSFVVEIDGSVSNAKIVRSVDVFLDKEALRVVNSFPKWKPGKQHGKAVAVQLTIPINFVLQ